MDQTPEPPPPNDYAARFARAQPPAQPAGAAPVSAAAAPRPSAPAPAPGGPYSFSDLFEASLTAPFRPWAAFAEAAARPAPGLGAAAGIVAAYAAAFFALNIVHAAALFPSAVSSQPPERVAIVGAAALLLALAASAAAAVVLQLAALATGGEGSFSRSYQAVALLALALPLEAASLWFPPLAPLPVILAAVGASAALERLHRSSAAGARTAAALLAFVTLGAGWLIAQGLDRAAAQYASLQQTLQQVQQATAASQAPAGAPPLSGFATPAPPPDAAAAASGLGLLVSPPGSGLDEAGPKTAAQANRAAVDALGKAAPLLNGANPALQDLTPQQRQQLQQVGAIVNQLQNQMRTGQGFTPQQQAQMMQMLRQMQQQANPAAGGARPSAPADGAQGR